MRRVGCAEGMGDVLVLVTQVGEENALLSGKGFHIVVTVFRKLHRVIGVHGNERYAFRGIVSVKRFEPIENEFYVRTVITHDDYAHRLMGL